VEGAAGASVSPCHITIWFSRADLNLAWYEEVKSSNNSCKASNYTNTICTTLWGYLEWYIEGAFIVCLLSLSVLLLREDTGTKPAQDQAWGKASLGTNYFLSLSYPALD